MPAAKILVEGMKKDFDAKLKEAINGVRNEVKSQTNNEIAAVNSEINKVRNDIKSHTNSEINKVKYDVKSQINDEIVNAKSDIKSHTNSEISKVKYDVKSYTNNEIAKAKSDVKSHTNSEISKAKSYTNSEDKKLEGRLRDWHSKHSGGITLHGSKSGPNRGTVYFQGRPICGDRSGGGLSWNIEVATVVCKMLGYGRATKAPHDRWEACYGSCPPEGIPFGLSGLKCTGKESHILDCEHEPTVSRDCGNKGYSYGSEYERPWDIVGVECTNDKMIGKYL